MDMFQSLRFRLPAFFLAGAVLAGLISTLIALGLFQDYTEDRLVAELRRERRGCRRSTPSRRSAPRTPTGRTTSHPLGSSRRAGARSSTWASDRLSRNDRAADAPAEHSRLEGRQAESVRVHAAQREPRVPGCCASGSGRRPCLRRAGRHKAEGRAARAVDDADRAAHARRVLRDRRRRRAGLVPLPSHHGARPEALAGGRQHRGGLYEVPEINASGEIGQLAERFREMAARLQEAGRARAQLPDDGLHELELR